MFVRSLVVVGLGFFAYANLASAAMSSSSYLIRWDAMSQGGSDSTSSASYSIRDAVGESGGGNSSSSSYSIRAGYRQGVYDETLSFNTEAMDASSGVTSTGFSSPILFVSSSASFAVDDLVVLITDRGGLEQYAFGRVSSIGSGTLLLDAITTLGSPAPDANNDFVYKLSGAAAAIGTIPSASIGTTVVGWRVSTEAQNGYTVSVMTDGELRSGTTSIPAVADGAVSSGSAEYGGRSSDVTLASSTFDTQDTALSMSAQVVGTRTAAAFNSGDILVLKAAYGSSTSPGTYSQALTIIAAANF